MKLSDLVGFGKYKRETYKYVFNNDPGYLVWVYTTMPGRLEGEMLTLTSKWMDDNPGRTKARIASIKKASDKNNQEKLLKQNPEMAENGCESFVPTFTAPVEQRSDVWGSW